MDYLREKSHGKNIRPVRENVLMFHEIVLNSVEHSGRLNEIGSVIRFNLQSGRPFRDAGLGLRMFLRGKLRLLHFRIGNIRQVRRIFECFRTGGKIS
jgi:heterodisulfide reductase subunit C